MMSLLSDLLDAAVAGVRKPAASSTGDLTTNPDFATAFDEALSTADTVGVDASLEDLPAEHTTAPRKLLVNDGADLVTAMEPQKMTQVGNPSDSAGVSVEMSVQAANPDAVTHRQGAGEAFEAIKDSLQESSVADLMEMPAGLGDQVALQGAAPASVLANVAAGNTEISSDVMTSGVQGETEGPTAEGSTAEGSTAKESTDSALHLSSEALSSDEALTLSMMAAGQGARVGQQFSNRPVSTVSTSNVSPGATSTGINAAGNALSDMTGSATSVETAGSNLHESSLNTESKMMDSLLIATRETTRVSQPEFISEQRPAVAAVGAASSNTAGIGETATKQSAFIEKPLDLNQSHKQQQATEMATHVRVLKNQGGGEAKINLHPAELGRMSISVSTEATDTKVSFVVETSQARQAVEAAMPRLKELLEQSGLSLADSDVTEQQKQSADEKRADLTSSSPSLESPEAAVGESELTLSVELDPSRLLDAYA